MKDLRPSRSERINPVYRQLVDYVTTGYHESKLVDDFSRIDALYQKLTPQEQKQYRQFLLRREFQLNALLESGNVTNEGDKSDCKTTVSVIKAMKGRINVLEPHRFDTWWLEDEPTQ